MTLSRFLRPLLAIATLALLAASVIGVDRASADTGDSDRLGFRPNWPEWIVRNLVDGKPIQVCSTEFPNATRDAIARWNEALGITAFTMMTGQVDCHLEYRNDWRPQDGVVRVTVASGEVRGSRLYAKQLYRADLCMEQPDHPICKGNTKSKSRAFAGFDNMVRARTLPGDRVEIVPEVVEANADWQTYFGRGEIVINPDFYDCDLGADLTGCKRNPAAIEDGRNLVHDITHELGHMLALADYYCEAWQSWLLPDRVEPDTPTVMNSWNLEPQCDPDDGRPTQLDKDDYRTAYRPAIVTSPAGASKRQTVTLTWEQDEVFVESHFEVQWRDEVNSSWAIVATADANAVSATLSGQTPGAQRYRVVSRTKALPTVRIGPVPPPGPTSAEVALSVHPLVAPRNLKLIASDDDLSGTFLWLGTAPRELKWELHRSEFVDRDFSLTETKTDSASPVTFADQDRGYWYKLRGRACETRTDPGGQQSGPGGRQGPPQAFEVCGDWAYSQPVEIAPLGVCEAISPGPIGASDEAGATATACIPSGETFEIVEDNTETTYNSISFEWTESAGATKYEVRVRLDGSTKEVKTATLKDATARSHKFDGLKPGTDYDIGVRGVNEFGDSGWQEDEATTDSVPAPTGLTVSAVTGTGATLEWVKPDDGIADFVVQLDGEDVDTAVGDVLSFSFDDDDEFKANTAHKLGVASVYDGVRSTFSELTLLVPPTLNTPTTTTSAITVSWRSNPLASGYDAKRVASDGDCSTGTRDAHVTTTSYTFTIPSSERGDEHRLCIRATNAEGASAWASTKARTRAVQQPPPQPRPPTCDPDEKPDETGTSETMESGYEHDGPARRPIERTVTQKQKRSVTCVSGTWNTGSWQNDGDPTNGPWTATGPWECTSPPERPAEEKRTITVSTTTAWVVSGDTASKVETVTKREDTNRFKFSGPKACVWNDDWKKGTPYTETETLETKVRPPDDIVHNPAYQTQTQTDWETIDDGLFCLQHERKRSRHKGAYFRRPHVWDSTATEWVDGTRNAAPYFIDPVFGNWSGWTYTLRTRPCHSSRQGADGEGGEQDAPTYRPAKLMAGAYELQWGERWLKFTVPDGTPLELRSRRLDSGVDALVFRTIEGVELEVDPSQLTTDTAQNVTLFSGVTDETLTALAGTLRLSVPPATGTATAEPEEEAACLAVNAPSDGAAAVDLDASTCIVVRGGGPVAVSHDGRTLSATLPAGRDWLVLAAHHAEDAEFEAIWFVDLESGAALALSPVDGEEVDREVEAGDTVSTARLDAIADSAVVPSGSAG